MATTKKETPLSREELIDQYENYLLTRGERPKNVYSFAKDLGIAEREFYTAFGDFDAIEEEILLQLWSSARELTEKTAGFRELSSKEQLLNLYYLFIENLSMNRSLVLMILDTDFKARVRRFKKLKARHRAFLETLNLKDWALFKKLPKDLKTGHEKTRHQILWMHFVSVLKFWKEDHSADFEKTSVYIEKSIDTGFELAEHPFMDKFFDLGKFLWQEF